MANISFQARDFRGSQGKRCQASSPSAHPLQPEDGSSTHLSVYQGRPWSLSVLVPAWCRPYRMFLAIAFRVLTLATSATFMEYSGAEKDAPMATFGFLNFIPESRAERAEQWNSEAVEPSRILCRLRSVMPPPGTTTILPFACSASLLIKDNPSSAELSQPLVNTRSNPREIRVSSATRGSCTMSKARWNVTGRGRHTAAKRRHRVSQGCYRVPCARTRNIHDMEEGKGFSSHSWRTQKNPHSCWEQCCLSRLFCGEVFFCPLRKQ